MKVDHVHVDGFGVWTDLDLAALSGRVTIVYGANETGKTTLMQFLRTMLYGFSADRRSRYVPPVHGGRVGGMLDVQAPYGGLEIERHLDQVGTPNEEEELAVRSPDGTPLTTTLLDQLLTNVDEATFNNVFAVGLRELQELGTLDDTKAADLLYKLTTGLDRVSLMDVMRDLQAERCRLLDPRDDAAQIIALVRRRDQLRARAGALAGEGRQWVELQAHLESLDEQTRSVQESLGEWEGELKVLDVALRVRDVWCQRGELRREIAALGKLREVPPTSLQKIESLRQRIAELERNLAELQRRRREFRREAAAQPVNQALWSQAARIEALVELAPWIASLQAQVDQLRGETAGMAGRLSRTSETATVVDGAPRGAGPELTPRANAILQGAARHVREESQRWKEAQADQAAAQEQLDNLTAELETALLDRGQERLADAVETAGASVGGLRRRVQLDQRLEQLTRQWNERQREHRELLEDQVLSPTTLAWLGVPFVGGVMLLLGGMVWSQAALLGWPMTLLGLVGWIVAMAVKVSLERTAAHDLERCEGELDVLKSQVQQVQAEQAELEAELPRGSGRWDARLAAAEKELASLEQLVPVEANLQAARQRLAAAQRRVEQCAAAVKESRGRWRATLRRLNLPEDLTPPAMRQFLAGAQQVQQARFQLDGRREELAAREQELQALTTRIHQLAQQVQLTYASQDPHVQLQRLSAALAEQQTLFERRQQLRQEDRRTRREARSVLAELNQARQQRRSIMSAAGARNEKQLRELLDRLAHRQSLRTQAEQVSEQYQVALGKESPRQQVEQLLEEHDAGDLQDRRARLAGHIDEARAQLAGLHQRRGAMGQQAAGLLADRRRAEIELELCTVEQQLTESVHRWRVLTIAWRALETVRDLYETHRQPQTLKDASRYFAALTEGQYGRIWTPLSDMALRVDMASGETLPLDVLSSGTREAVFLSLRLALVADFARRGVVLPLVLDDVLVNFDARRARAASRVLCQFAEQGHQVLLFTCHAHIVELFAAAHVDIRYLSPLHEGRDLAVEPPQPAAAEIPDLVETIALAPEPAWELVDHKAVDQSPADDVALEEYVLGEPVAPVPTPLFAFLITTPDDAESPALADHVPLGAEDVAPLTAQESADYELTEACDTDVEPLDAVPAVVEEFVEQRVTAREVPAPEPRRQRFTWESPERWWDGTRDDEAA
ncbi:MAG: AAA family ATPase [Pirellulaceae bacterium]|jgi:uncharacterized protein YhaN|nr:AAA family ATPase [Pirellulaceae bacterium]